MDPRLESLPRPTPEDMIGKQNGKLQQKPTLCPFGCKEDEPSMTAHGYCRHLIGWSVDGKTYERRERIVNTDIEICRGEHPVDKAQHICVAMQSGLRVYHKSGRAPFLIEKPKPRVLAPEVADEQPFEEEADLEELTRPQAV